MLKTITLLAGALLTPLLSTGATFSGNFAQDDSFESFRLFISGPVVLSARTTSFATGGFAPVLSLFDDNGLKLLLDFDHAGGTGPDCGPRGTDLATGLCWDAYLHATLGIGSYLLFLTQDDNLPVGPTLADGFLQSGQGNFTGPNFTGLPGSFLLITGDQRTSAWVLNIDIAPPTTVPEPGTALLIAVGVTLAFLSRRHFPK